MGRDVMAACIFPASRFAYKLFPAGCRGIAGSGLCLAGPVQAIGGKERMPISGAGHEPVAAFARKFFAPVAHFRDKHLACFPLPAKVSCRIL